MNSYVHVYVCIHTKIDIVEMSSITLFWVVFLEKSVHIHFNSLEPSLGTVTSPHLY